MENIGDMLSYVSLKMVQTDNQVCFLAPLCPPPPLPFQSADHHRAPQVYLTRETEARDEARAALAEKKADVKSQKDWISQKLDEIARKQRELDEQAAAGGRGAGRPAAVKTAADALFSETLEFE